MDGLPEPEVSRVFCDKLALTVPQAFWEAREHALDVLETLRSGEKAKRSRRGKIYKRSYLFDVSINDEVPGELIVQCDPRYGSIPFGRLEWNPANADMARVRTLVDAIFPITGYQSVVQRGKCTRADITVDLHGVDINQLLIWQAGKQANATLRLSRLYGRTGKLETYYLGSKKGNLLYRVYDKRKQLKKKAKWDLNPEAIPKSPTPAPSAWTRIEAVVKNFPFRELATQPNPFATLGVADRLLVPNSDEKFKLFLKACRAEGPHNVLWSLSPELRTIFTKRLQEGKPDWWDADKVWKDWPSVAGKLLGFKPTFSMSMAQKQTEKP